MVPNGFRLDQCLDGLNCRVREGPQLAEELVIGTKVDIGVGLVPQRPPFSISKKQSLTGLHHFLILCNFFYGSLQFAAGMEKGFLCAKSVLSTLDPQKASPG